MSGKLKKNIGFTLLPFAFIFLFEPSFALLDPLPDFIGYAILCASLINLADINPTVMDAFKGFRRAAIFSGLRLIAFALVNFVFEGQEQTITQLLLIFVFALFDAIFLIPAYKNLFSGILNLGTYNDGTAVYYAKKEGKANASEKMYVFSIIFVVLKILLWVLPEFTALANDEKYEFIHVLRFFALVIIVPVSILWLVKMLVYFSKVKKDRAFIENLESVYVDKAQASPSFFTMRTSCVGITAFVVGVALSLDFMFDNVNVTPDALMYLALIVGAVIVRNYSKKWIFVVVSAAFGVAAGVFCDLSRTYFYSRYIPTDVIKDIGAYNSYYFMLSISILETVAFLVAVIAVLTVTRDIYIKNTDLVFDIGEKEIRRMNKKFIWGSVITYFFGIISCAANLFYIYALPNAEKAEIFAMSNVLRMALGIIFVFVFWYFAGYVKSCVKQHCKSNLY